MDLTDIGTIKSLLTEYDVHPKKFRGQNFICSKKALQKIIDFINPRENDVFIEIGSGLGVLTVELAKRSKKVVALEVDEDMVKISREKVFLGSNNVDVKQVDARRVSMADIVEWTGNSRFRVVGNVPYYASSALIRHFASLEACPQDITFLIQQELAERLAAVDGKMSKLHVFTRALGEIHIGPIVTATKFYPEPKIDSQLVKINSITGFSGDFEKFEKVVNAGFGSKRKTLRNNLKRMFEDIDANISPELLSLRPEKISVENWKKISNLL